MTPAQIIAQASMSRRGVLPEAQLIVAVLEGYMADAEAAVTALEKAGYVISKDRSPPGPAPSGKTEMMAPFSVRQAVKKRIQQAVKGVIQKQPVEVYATRIVGEGKTTVHSDSHPEGVVFPDENKP